MGKTLGMSVLWEKLLGRNVAILIKTNSTAEALRYGLCKIAVINFEKCFARFFFVIPLVVGL